MYHKVLIHTSLPLVFAQFSVSSLMSFQFTVLKNNKRKKKKKALSGLYYSNILLGQASLQ